MHWIGLLDRLVNSYLIWLVPAPGASAPVRSIRLAGFQIDLGTLLSNANGLSIVLLNGCHEPDAAVTVPLVAPIGGALVPANTPVCVGRRRPASLLLGSCVQEPPPGL